MAKVRVAPGFYPQMVCDCFASVADVPEPLREQIQWAMDNKIPVFYPALGDDGSLFHIVQPLSCGGVMVSFSAHESRADDMETAFATAAGVIAIRDELRSFPVVVSWLETEEAGQYH